MTHAVVAWTRLEAASRALVTALRAEAATTDDDELRSLLEASRAAVERETRMAARSSTAAVDRKVRELEWRLAVLADVAEAVRVPRGRGWRRDADLTDFLVDVRPRDR
ncbi:hypothetical protein [Agrococcus jejuensis]|uniref:Uncharacterized protein n=1 Tax=Agrococcus jejuensis TaxID=399736 RepID=A0A1G8E759_9MICO|nr:hypothetical protein [Agrococcus jejuensis]SDH65540.1 hypothetical protein SAMN04489720_1908 [Agrococcus jejuensis]